MLRLRHGPPHGNDEARAHEEEPLRRRPQGHVQRRLGRTAVQRVPRQARPAARRAPRQAFREDLRHRRHGRNADPGLGEEARPRGRHPRRGRGPRRPSRRGRLGRAKGKFVKIVGTSTCDICVWPADGSLPDVPGLCGIVDGSVLPGYLGLEAGQSAVGDIFNWFVNEIQPGGPGKGSHEALTRKAARLRPGQSGLLALDWNNGNRTVLVDQRLTGLLVGQTLRTRPEEIYRALIEATAFGALIIIRRHEEYGIAVDEVRNCGGIPEKNPLVMQIYADVTGKEMKIARSAQTCALGAAIAGAVVAGKAAGGYAAFPEAQAAMTGVKKKTYKPDPRNRAVYAELYGLYKQLHDAFGTKEGSGSLYNVMKDLLDIRDRQLKVAGRTARG